MGLMPTSWQGAPYSQNPGVYNYVHLGTAAGTTQIGGTQPILIGYLQINSHALGTIVAYDCAGTAGTATTNVIGSISITSVSGSAPLGFPMFASLTTKNGLVFTNTANLDLTVAYLP